MPYNEHMANRMRELIALRTSNVTEKKMFGGLCFLVDDKICVAAKADKMFLRIAPELYDDAIELPGCEPMSRFGKNMTGYLYVDYEQLRTHQQLAHWVNLALDFNPLAKSSKQP